MSPETEKLLRDALLPHEFAEIQSLHQMYRDDSFWLGGTAALVLVSCVERLATALRAAEGRAEANAEDAEVVDWLQRHIHTDTLFVDLDPARLPTKLVKHYITFNALISRDLRSCVRSAMDAARAQEVDRG